MKVGELEKTMKKNWNMYITQVSKHFRKYGISYEIKYFLHNSSGGSDQENPASTEVDWISPEDPTKKVRVNAIFEAGTVIFGKEHLNSSTLKDQKEYITDSNSSKELEHNETKFNEDEEIFHGIFSISI